MSHPASEESSKNSRMSTQSVRLVNEHTPGVGRKRFLKSGVVGSLVALLSPEMSAYKSYLQYNFS